MIAAFLDGVTTHETSHRQEPTMAPGLIILNALAITLMLATLVALALG